MQEIIFIDGGSLPTPEGLPREWVKAAAENRNEDEKLFSMIREAFRRKIDVGVHVPTYPQFRDKIGQFLDLSLIHISEPTRRTPISYAVFCLKKKKKEKKIKYKQ